MRRFTFVPLVLPGPVRNGFLGPRAALPGQAGQGLKAQAPAWERVVRDSRAHVEQLERLVKVEL